MCIGYVQSPACVAWKPTLFRVCSPRRRWEERSIGDILSSTMLLDHYFMLSSNLLNGSQNILLLPELPPSGGCSIGSTCMVRRIRISTTVLHTWHFHDHYTPICDAPYDVTTHFMTPMSSMGHRTFSSFGTFTFLYPALLIYWLNWSRPSRLYHYIMHVWHLSHDHSTIVRWITEHSSSGINLEVSWSGTLILVAVCGPANLMVLL